ncbi:MAG: TSUP family transporter [Desulfobulbaceae bacterium]|nr:TSUP family transporter [Desulfobulbaceae bacterium]
MEIQGFTVDILLFLVVAAFISGFLDTLAGGGGLIALPALILSGISPLLALGTNKLQGTMGTATATIVMLRSRRVRWEDVKFLMFTAFIGSMLGTIAVQFINTEILHFVIPAVLLFIAVYFLFSPQLQTAGSTPKISDVTYRRIVVPLLGWYDGMFGPGTGSFFALAGVSLRGHGLIDATAIAKTLNFSTNFASLLIFLLAGKVVWLVGLVMMVGQFMGAWAGSHCLLRIDPKYLRLVVVVMCLGMLIKYVHSMGWFV